MKVLCVFGKFNYGVSKRGIGYEYANFIPALKNLGHEVVFLESLNKSYYKDYSDLNRKLLLTVDREKPDIIFCVLMTYEIWLETIQLIREGSNAALINWATDDSWKYEQFTRFLAPFFDVIATTYPSAISKAKFDGYSNLKLSQWAAVSNNFINPLPSNECSYDLSFIGTKYGNREKWITCLANHGINVTCFGFGWPNGPISAEEIPHVINKSRICLNFGDSGLNFKRGKFQRSRQIKARVFEVPGAGGLLMTESVDNLEKYYSLSDEIVVFDGIDDMVNKVKELLANPNYRDVIAEAGFNRTISEHSYEKRFQSLIEEALRNRQNRKNVSANIEISQYESMASSHRLNLILKIFKILLTIPCLLVWGKKRGPRAARKLLFEVSWRISGRKTYSVVGLPGRMFYIES